MNFYIIPSVSGTISTMEGFEKLCPGARVVDFHICKRQDDQVLVPPFGFESIGWILVRGNSHADAALAMQQICNLLKVTVTPVSEHVPVLPQQQGAFIHSSLKLTAS